MKSKQIKRMVCLLLLFSFMLSLSSFATDKIAESTQANVAKVYSLVPGTKEWRESTFEERISSCMVSNDEVKRMTTEALVKTVVNYPYLINVFAYDTIAKGIEQVSSYFPGLLELLSRPDALDELKRFKEENEVTLKKNNSQFSVHFAGMLIDIVSVFESDVENSSSRAVAWLDTLKRTGVVLASTDQTYDMIMPGVSAIQRDRNEQAFFATYPSLSRVFVMSPEYNCHSYAWHSASVNNEYWVFSCSEYISPADGSYIESSYAVGNKVTYMSRSSGTHEHSGIVTGSQGGIPVVTSKWGGYSLFQHKLYDCPYAVLDGATAYIKYWAVNPN